MKKRIVIASGNAGKIREFKEIFSDMNFDVVSMHDAGADMDIDETGTTFAENAFIKAEAVKKVCSDDSTIVIADDSGLVIDYLSGEPGVLSSRYMGTDTPYEIKNKMILERMKFVLGDERSAHFTAAIACIIPLNLTKWENLYELRDDAMFEHIAHEKNAGKEIFSVALNEGDISYMPLYNCVLISTQADMNGLIAEKACGSGGFGYDPIFYLPGYGKTSAELELHEKNEISHRGKSLKHLKTILDRIL